MKQYLSHISYYRIFDVADEVDLEQAKSVLENESETSRFTLRKSNRSLFINDAPVVVSLGESQKNFNGVRRVETVAKIWSYGAISIQFKVYFDEELELTTIRDMGIKIDENEEFFNEAKSHANGLMGKVFSAVKKFNLSEVYEDYLIYSLINKDGKIVLDDMAKNKELYSLVLLDKVKNPSEQLMSSIQNDFYQYANDDLVILDWNSAVIMDNKEDRDVKDVIEFALSQMLEMQYYDDLLDKRMNSLYNSIKGKKSSIFSNRYSRLSEEAGKLYLEINELIENVENSLKVVGDFYYAKIFRAASSKFRYKDWRDNIENKLDGLRDYSAMLHGEINEKRNQLLELIIIILIAVEIVPLFFKVF
jgi:uncharacterized Rmd1/YagE family protein